MKKAITSKCNDCAYRGRHIYVVGAFRFEREIVADYISTHTAAKWFQVESLESIPVSNKGVPLGKKMILIDTMTMTRDNLIQLLSSKIWQSHAHNLMALFNLPHEYAIEKIALKSGVRGFLYCDDRAEDLINGICSINTGVIWISRRILSEYVQDSSYGNELLAPNGHSLSEREIELLQVLAAGASNEVIANQMGISPHTVKSHLYNIFHKINADNRLQAALWAQKNL
jgi:DNA-binding NarL/FixJ family response regulator